MQTIQAIKTPYKGILFNSRLEARWAVFFDEAGIRWEYEKEGYELDSGHYLPDFYLPDVNNGSWFEVKGEYTNDLHAKLASDLSRLTNKEVYVSYGQIQTPEHVIKSAIENSRKTFCVLINSDIVIDDSGGDTHSTVTSDRLRDTIAKISHDDSYDFCYDLGYVFHNQFGTQSLKQLHHVSRMQIDSAVRLHMQMNTFVAWPYEAARSARFERRLNGRAE